MYSHAKFVDRAANWARAIRQLQIEQVALQEIYKAQADNGASSDFVDFGDTSADELRDLMEVVESYGEWLDGSGNPTQKDRRTATVPFIQSS